MQKTCSADWDLQPQAGSHVYKEGVQQAATAKKYQNSHFAGT